MFSKSQSQSHRRVSLAENFEKVKNQIAIDCFDREDTGMVWEIALIMAEVMTLPEDFTISIGGEKLPVELVREVYRNLENEHIKFVIEKFKGIDREIKHRKSYLRTALYNAPFETESDAVNFYNAYF